ncbi:hypothetical protein M434DRAFT_401502 [Hypoxylon sp. CO27-5]|nr:hypothetical protein M434DRAFT_401502 [Hypoxylon sp. CO27-5]
MAEPVGLLGTVVGVVSLGLQVYGGLKKYLDDYQSRDKHVSKALFHLKHLQQSLEGIKSIIPSIENGYRKPADTVMSSLQAAQNELQILHDKLKENEPANPVDLKGKMKETKKKLAFPFRISDLNKLELTLENIVKTLSIAMQGLGLNISYVIDAKVANIYDAVSRISPELSALDTNIHAILAEQAATAVREVDSQLALNTSLQSVEHSISEAKEQVCTSMQLSYSKIQKRLEEIELVIKDRGVPPNNNILERAFTGMMVAKPALLREASEDANLNLTTPFSSAAANLQDIVHQDTDTASNWKPQALSSCNCGRRRRRITRKSSRRSWLYTFEEEIMESKHNPGCSFFLPGTSEHQRTFGILFTGLHRYLSTAVSLSLCMRSGAGGSSISPTIRYFAMVDLDKSPAFRIVEVLAHVLFIKRETTTWNKALQEMGRSTDLVDTDIGDISSLQISNYRDILHIGIPKLRQIFRSGVASPTDVTIDGGTLIHVAVGDIDWWIPRFNRRVGTMFCPGYLASERGMAGLYDLYDLLKALSELGVPCNTPAGPAATSVVDICLGGNIRTSNIQTQQKKFLAEDITTHLLLRKTSSDMIAQKFDIVQFRDSVAESEPLLEALGLDSPIYIAVLRRNESDLRRIIQDSPTDPSIQNPSWPTLAHVAIGWPVGLEILLKAIPTLDINSKYCGESLFSLAMRYSRSTCKGRSVDKCNDCACAKSVTIILEAGCYLSFDEVRQALRRPSIGSARAVSIVLEHIKMWRDKLKSLLFDHIPEIKFSGQYDSAVLDVKTGEAIATLERKGIFPFQWYSLEPDDYRLGCPSYFTESLSIYHLIENAAVAEEAFELGFRDLDVAYDCQTPLMKNVKESHLINMAYVYWLIAHGATSYTNQMSYKSFFGSEETAENELLPKRTASHVILYNFGIDVLCGILLQGGDPGSSLNYEYPRLFQTFLIGDGCKCGCSRSPDGCYPITVFLNSFLWWFRLSNEGDRKYSYDQAVLWVCDNFLSPIAKKVESNVLTEAIIRAFTFDYLTLEYTNSIRDTKLRGLRHTCCATLRIRPGPSDLESYGEDHEEIRNEDHALLCKLDELVLEFMGRFSREACSLSEFIGSHWFPGMEEVVHELENNNLVQLIETD